MLKFALVGNDPALLPLVLAVQSLGHELSCAFEAEPIEAGILSVAPRMRRGTKWEEVLNQETADVVLYGFTPDSQSSREDQLRLLVQAERPLLTTHPASSLLLAYELDMIREQSGSVLHYYTPGMTHPALAEMSELLQAGPQGQLGEIEQILFERTLRAGTKQRVLPQFARDASLLIAVCGKLDKVGALGAPDDDSAYASLAVQMSGPTGVPVRWSIGPAHEVAGGNLVLVGSHGKVMLQMPEQGAWVLTTRLVGKPVKESELLWDAAADAVEDVELAVEHGDDRANWAAAMHSLELADAVERSLQKGRTITLHFEEHSEQSTFKGIMAAMGCGLLMLGMVVLVAAGLFAFLGDLAGVAPQKNVARIWPYLLLGAFGLFLILQFLPLLVFGKKRQAERSAEPGQGT